MSNTPVTKFNKTVVEVFYPGDRKLGNLKNFVKHMCCVAP